MLNVDAIVVLSCLLTEPAVVMITEMISMILASLLRTSHVIVMGLHFSRVTTVEFELNYSNILLTFQYC